MEITGIILAGGKSLRMGSDKALMEFEGKTLLERAVDFCRSACTQIIVSSNFDIHNIEGIQRVADEYPDCGPLGGIYSSLKHSVHDWNFVLSIDSPFVEHDFLRFLIAHTNKYDAVIPVHRTGNEPLIALYHRKILPLLQLQINEGNYKMQVMIKKINACFADSNHWLEISPKLFHNLNSPLDWNSIR